MYYVDAWHGGPVEEGMEKHLWVMKDFCSFKILSLKGVILYLYVFTDVQNKVGVCQFCFHADAIISCNLTFVFVLRFQGFVKKGWVPLFLVWGAMSTVMCWLATGLCTVFALVWLCSSCSSLC